MKKFLLIMILAAAAVACVALYASVHLTFKAQTLETDPVARIRNLDRAGALDPLNESSYQLAGLTHLDRAANDLADVPQAKVDLEKAYADFRKSLRLNPGSATSHFYYAKTLTLMRYLGLNVEDNPFQELQKAARLAGSRQQMDEDIGTTLLSQWGSLSAEEKAFTEALLQKSLLLEDVAAFEEVLNLWDLNVRDYAVMDKILPQSPTLLRTYAQFLGEKSLSLAARRKALAQAEALDYDLAWKDYESGQNFNKYGRLTDSADRYSSCLSRLKKIKFYSYLTGDPDVGASIVKKTTLLRTVNLELGKARLEDNRNMAAAEGPLRSYLALENNYDQIAALESYLKEMRIVPEAGVEQSIKNVHDLAFQVLLMFDLHKYRQIVSLGTQLQHSLVVPDEQTKKDLSEIFQFVGDSYLKLDFVYESEVFYQKALELTPMSLDVLFRMKKYYERRNEEDKGREVDRLLNEVLTAGNLMSQNRLLSKGTVYAQPLILNVNQKKVRLDFQFGILPGNPQPLVSIFLNDRVYWEDYVAAKAVSLELDAVEGVNELQLVAVNGPVALTNVSFAPIAAEERLLGSSVPGKK